MILAVERFDLITNYYGRRGGVMELTRELFIEGFCGERKADYASTNSESVKKILESIDGITDIEFSQQSTHYWYVFNYRGRKLSIGGDQGHEGNEMELYVCDYEHGVGLGDCVSCMLNWGTDIEIINDFKKWYDDSCRIIKKGKTEINW